uniref:Cathepsin propeptide inhibitor domain-containing protein n=1 Tax=Oryza barthii TaxID=65489 RepID=A0A0D3FRV3_9ORYZ
MASSPPFRLPLAVVLLLAIICVLLASPSCHADDLTATMTNEHEKEHQLMMMMMDRFHRWMATHNRSYASADEKLRRFEVYRSNMEFIEATNRNGSLTFKLGETPFTDLTHEEFLATYTGGVRLPPERRGMQDDSDEEDAVITTSAGYVAGAGAGRRTAAVPESVDWRKEGAVTPAKHQGQCAACWAFAAVAAIESLHKIKGGDLISLSEQELVDCNDTGNGTCSKGYSDDAFLWVSKNKGIASDLIYPYVGHKESCKKQLLGVHNATVRGVVTLPENREDLIMAAVARQPVAVVFDAGDPLFQNYRGNGVYKGGTGCSTNVNHALTIVGYGTNHPDTGENYWIAKNSYGNLWGDNGFVYLAKDTADRTGVCGLAIWPTFPTIR